MAKKPSPKRDLAGIKSLQIPLFGGWLMLTLDRDQHDRAMKWLGQEPSPDSDFTGLGFCQEYDDKEGRQCIVVHVSDWRLDTLVHELSHAVFMICDHKGVETDKGKRETFAYLIDYLFAEFYPPTTQRWQAEEDKREAAEKKAKRQKVAKEKKNDPA